MPPPVSALQIDQLVDLLSHARDILVFTGAGISTGSGIPDFRGPQGLWKRMEPIYFDEFRTDREKRLEYWRRKRVLYRELEAARPNPAHFAVARLEELGRVRAVVTQNIDGLHQDAGTSDRLVIEVHGTNRWVACLDCRSRINPDEALAMLDADPESSPRCECGGLLKPATISFGQSLDQPVIEAAFSAALDADLVLALGSTLSVQPAAQVPLEAARRGAPYVIINQGATDHDPYAVLRIEGDVAEVLPTAVERVPPAVALA